MWNTQHRPVSWAFCLRSLLSARRGEKHTVTTTDCTNEQLLLLAGTVPKQQFQWLGLGPIQEFHLTGSVSNIVIWSFSICKCTCWARSLTAIAPVPSYPSSPVIVEAVSTQTRWDVKYRKPQSNISAAARGWARPSSGCRYFLPTPTSLSLLPRRSR